MHPKKGYAGQECKEACMDEEGAPGKTHAQKGKLTEGGSKDR